MSGRTDTERLDWIAKQDVVVGEHASYGRWKDVVLARYQRSFPADLMDIRHTIDAAMDAEGRDE
ncbi:hypothetical protein [Gluconobacter roseus]|uniref:Uncharacterized protein n=1 Tax=Gluconobacter roseus NBRC 3990 TaxID=1307950 RepID=A0A4Y3M8V2_9PROT|nr:hypothetical protein [Gluconobacter roseus]KXV43094.1 hypothetical protein AD943_08905 [Gluconobacter roseus]GBR43256.1 hypothetical protein AA3990_0364 [Gluconobacter roseus NBRC 3990]GEB03898.1 hypothetical protein GRO01_14740 [Gluconobacter roseus NBRC 3990]GLP94351.1 hypothetical protein GCM10007871_23290 [Gluconobacter roseus NBRC 3990]